jgi:DNA-binding GntR family transcriptional regulator
MSDRIVDNHVLRQCIVCAIMRSAMSITSQLRDEILEGVFPPGERLVEINLSQRYGVGRAAIRAALVVLDSEGLVDREANRGATVRRISIGEAIEIAEARGMLEGLLARHAAVNANDAERGELRAIVGDMRVAVNDGDQLAYSKLNATFHRRLREISRHAIANELVANLRNRAAHHQYRLALMPGRPDVSLAQHLAIVEAIVVGDPPAAERAMREHLRSVADVLRQWAELGANV